MKKLTFVFFSAILFSCQNQSLKNNVEKDSKDTNKISTESYVADTSSLQIPGSIPPPSIEEAETLVSRYYSARNQEMKYPFYKGLGLKILDIKRIDQTDSFLVLTHITGRKWPNPNKDTSTLPFEESKQLRTFKLGTIWQADSVGLK